MKKIIILLLPMLACGTAFAQLSPGEFSEVRLNSTYVNTIKPGFWSSNFRSGLIHESTGSINYGIYGDSLSGFRFRWLAHNNTAISYNTDERLIMHLDNTGVLNVKTGIVSPNPIFGSNINSKYNKVVILGPNQPAGVDSKRDISFEFQNAGKTMIRSYRGGSWDTYMQFLTNPASNAGYVDPIVHMHINHDGKVGIGTTTPQSLLAVNGDITAKKVKVTQTGWPDYVFDPAFDLRPLLQVEAHILRERRLPDVPSATEIEKKGLDIGEMQKIQMQKIEEITLYLIELKKENDKLKDKVAALEKESQALKAAASGNKP
ncbi:bZIP transcription factor [Chitinophaga deserti]|uniref:bZIP transcription factor n=1 Tax=Chitinophaga deserti TaxID=2164099 RepID=UPI000D6CEAAB|nr:bZIP transcription factor [Chitinophaga deserti]